MFAQSDAEVKFKVVLDDNEAGKSVDNLSKKTDNLSKKLTSFGKTMSVGVTLPLTALATAGIKYNASMETYMANLTTLLNGNQEAASQLLSDLKAMANTTPFETTSLVKATQTMLGFGIQVQDSQKYLKQLGDISMGDAQKLESLTLAFSQVSSAGKLSGQDLLQMINAGFNPLNIISQKTGESMASLKERMGEGALSAQEVAQALEWATEKGGLFYGAMDKASQTTEGKLSTLTDEFNSAVGELTTGLLPTFTKVVDKLTEMSRWFSNLSPEQKDFIVKMGLILASIGPVVGIIGKLISTGKKIKTIVTIIKSWNLATKAMTAAQTALNAVMNMNPISLIIIGITALIAAIVLLWNNCEWFRDGIKAIIDFIVNLFTSIGDFLFGIFENIKNIIGQAVTSISNFFVGLWNSILVIFSPAIQWFTQLFTSIWQSIKSIIDVIVGLFKGSWELIKIVWGIVAQWFNDNVIQPIVNFFTPIVEWFANIFRSAWEGIKSIWISVSSWFNDTIIQPISNFFTEMWNKLTDGASKAWEGIKSVFSSVVNWFKNVFTNAWEGVKNVFSTGGKIFDGIKEGIANVFKTVVNGIIGGINKVIAVPFNTINGLLNKIRSVSVAGIEPFKGLIKYNALSVPQIPKLNVGTNYVEQEGLAYLHEGEAVVPKKYNPAIGNSGGRLLSVENSNRIVLEVDRKTLAEVVNNYNFEREVAV